MADEKEKLARAQQIIKQIKTHHQQAGEVTDFLSHAIDTIADPDHAEEHLGEVAKRLINWGMRAWRAGHAAPTGPIVDADPNPPSKPQQ